MCIILSFFFFNDTATTEIYTLSLHDALPICVLAMWHSPRFYSTTASTFFPTGSVKPFWDDLYAAGAELIINRSEEHTSELQSQSNLVCRLLLEKKNNISDV